MATADDAISNAADNGDDKDDACHCHYDTCERTGFLDLTNLVIGDLHVAIDARCVFNPGAHYAQLIGKLTNVDDCQNEESDAEDHVEDANQNMIAWFAATVFAESTYKDGF